MTAVAVIPPNSCNMALNCRSKFFLLHAAEPNFSLIQKVNEYDQEMPQSHTTDHPTAP